MKNVGIVTADADDDFYLSMSLLSGTKETGEFRQTHIAGAGRGVAAGLRGSVWREPPTFVFGRRCFPVKNF